MKMILRTPTPDLAQSLEFYTRLGYTVLSEKSPTLVSDGTVVMEIDKERSARAGVKCFAEDWSAALAELRKTTKVHDVDDGHVFSDPSGVRVHLVTGTAPALDLSNAKPSKLGNCMGLSLESMDPERSVLQWTALGFKIVMGKLEDGFVVMAADGCPGVSIMRPFICPHLFFDPSLTFFNGKEGNPAVIEQVRKAGITITEEISHFNKEGIVDNIIIRDPGGFGFFIFND